MIWTPQEWTDASEWTETIGQIKIGKENRDIIFWQSFDLKRYKTDNNQKYKCDYLGNKFCFEIQKQGKKLRARYMKFPNLKNVATK